VGQVAHALLKNLLQVNERSQSYAETKSAEKPSANKEAGSAQKIYCCLFLSDK
jgi:hypothetical protein